jgi:sulfur dioxygenase
MIFKQLFDQATWTYTYLLADPKTREAVIIDPVVEKVERDLKLIAELGLKLVYTLDTHVHADHVTGSGKLRTATGAFSVVSAVADVECVDQSVAHGDRIRFGALELEVRSTPGHTDGCVTYVIEDNGQTLAFTGDAIFIRGSGRTDFQQGDSKTLYQSVHNQIFSLPDDTVIYPGHDYRGHISTTVAEEKAHNPRLKLGVSETQFVEIMADLELANPKMMDIAVPANLSCGVTQPSHEILPQLDEFDPNAVSSLAHYRVIDVRQPEEFYGQLGHIEGAELVPLAMVSAHAALWAKEEPVLVVCRTGGRATSAGELLLELGFKEVANLTGGMVAWNEAHHTAIAGELQ